MDSVLSLQYSTLPLSYTGMTTQTFLDSRTNMRTESKIHLALVIITFIICGVLQGQTRPEIIPYRLKSIDYEPDSRLELGIVVLHPSTFNMMVYNIQREETLEIIYERINFETIYPDRAGEIFSIDSKLYVLIRIPDTGASWDYNRDWY